MATSNANIIAHTEEIEKGCATLNKARTAVAEEKDKLSQLTLQSAGTQGGQALEGVTAEKYQKIHEDLIQVAETSLKLMDALIACIKNYRDDQQKTDQSSANTFGGSGNSRGEDWVEALRTSRKSINPNPFINP